MSKTYNILWIDDECNDEAMIPFLVQAEQHGIILNGYSSYKAGFNALEERIQHYDAILLDALFFEHDHSETVGNKGLGASLAKINELKSKKVFPYFVLSGQSSFTELRNDILEANNLKCYNKKNPSDIKELFTAIKNAADQYVETQIKHENQSLFDILTEYPDFVCGTFISIFKGLRGLNHHFEDQLYFTQLRIILELVFRKANKLGLLHDCCVQIKGGQVNLTESSLFLSGYETKYLNVKCKVTHFPKVISENVKNIIFTTGAASHSAEVDVTTDINIQEYRKLVKTPYLLNLLAFQLMDVIIWLKEYSKENSNAEKNRSYWQHIDVPIESNTPSTLKGFVCRVADNDYGTFRSNDGNIELTILPITMASYGLSLDQKIEVTTEASPDGKKTYIKEVSV